MRPFFQRKFLRSSADFSTMECPPRTLFFESNLPSHSQISFTSFSSLQWDNSFLSLFNPKLLLLVSPSVHGVFDLRIRDFLNFRVCSTMAEEVMVIGVDESEHSFYALNWTLQHFFGPNDTPYKLVIVNAKPPPSSLLGIAGPAAVDVLPLLDADLKKIANRTVQKAKDICIEHKVQSVQTEVVEGDARNVMCDSVEKFHASILVVGSHNYGVVKRMGLGSVSDFCAHHAHCSVMIVKRPPKPMT